MTHPLTDRRVVAAQGAGPTTARPSTTAGRPSWLPYDEYPFEDRYLELPDARLHYIDEGIGPVLLFVHAGPAWSFIFRGLIVRLREDFRCVALDFPGSGLSPAPVGYRPQLAGSAEILDRFIRALDLREVGLVVHDLGGPVAIGAVARHPERIRAMAVTESFAWPLARENPRIARMLRIVGSRPFRLLNQLTNLLAWVGSTSYGAGRHLSRAGRRAFLGPYRDRSARRHAVAMLHDVAHADGYLRDVDRIVRSHFTTRPMLLIYGAESPGVKESFPERWRARVPDAQLLLVPGAHHFPMADDPDAVAGAIRRWWEATATV